MADGKILTRENLSLAYNKLLCGIIYGPPRRRVDICKDVGRDVGRRRLSPLLLVAGGRGGGAAAGMAGQAGRRARPMALSTLGAMIRCIGVTGSMYSRPSQLWTWTTVVTVTCA